MVHLVRSEEPQGFMELVSTTSSNYTSPNFSAASVIRRHQLSKVHKLIHHLELNFADYDSSAYESFFTLSFLLFNIASEGVILRAEKDTSGTIFRKFVQLFGFADDIDILSTQH